MFEQGKKYRKDVSIFAQELFFNLKKLQKELQEKTYQHGVYEHFVVSDPKRRDIHKALVRDRVVHHIVYDALYPYFDRFFIFDSYSCRKNKGTHRALNRFRDMYRQCSKNNTKQCWVLKCDIRKFFASIDHEILQDILQKHIADKDILWLLDRVIGSFCSHPLSISPSGKGRGNTGLPLGNLTSQLLVNIYMHEFDVFVKQELSVKYYIRYADDFVVLSQDRNYLEKVLNHMQLFLREKLKLEMHPDKVYIKTYASGVDFLGWVHFPYHRVLRAVTRRRMVAKIKISDKKEIKSSYRGMLSHGNGYRLKKNFEL